MKTNLINRQEALDELCDIIPSSCIIALDTEFVRRDSYFAKLSLVQIAFNDKIFVIDALRTGIKSLWHKIIESNSVIVIHAGRQDIEILFHLFHMLPSNIVDTQIAAKLCGYGLSVSYAELCEKICDIKLDKKYQAANWLQRELPQEMLDYAAVDVVCLEKIYQFLMKKIDEKSMRDQLKSEVIKSLLNPDIYKIAPEFAWKKVKFSHKNPDLIKKMQILAAFREESAVELDIPRGFFVSDVQLVQICNILPTNSAMLKKIHNLKPWIKRPEYSSKLFDLCAGMIEELV